MDDIEREARRAAGQYAMLKLDPDGLRLPDTLWQQFLDAEVTAVIPRNGRSDQEIADLLTELLDAQSVSIGPGGKP